MFDFFVLLGRGFRIRRCIGLTLLLARCAGLRPTTDGPVVVSQIGEKMVRLAGSIGS